MSLVVACALLSTLVGSASSTPGRAFSALASESEGIQHSGLHLRRAKVVDRGARSLIEPTLKLQSNEDGVLPFALWVGARFHGARGSALDVHFDLAHLAVSGLKMTPAGRMALSGVKWARRGHGLLAPFGGLVSQRWRGPRQPLMGFAGIPWRVEHFQPPFFAFNPMVPWPRRDLTLFDIQIRIGEVDSLFLALTTAESKTVSDHDVGPRGCRLVR